MRIDNNIIRNLLMDIEDTTTFGDTWNIRNQKSSSRIQKVELDKIKYHLRYLHMAGYLYVPDDCKKYRITDFYSDLSPTGHEFLNSIRTPEIWKDTKKLISKAGSFSLKFVAATAECVATAYVNKMMGNDSQA